MININKLKIAIFDLTYMDNPISEEYVLYEMLATEHTLVVLLIDTPLFRYELEDCQEYKVYDLIDYKSINFSYATQSNCIEVIEYSGANLDINGILDIMLDESLDEPRRSLLKSVLYYKSNQEGRELKTHKLRVKHFDDLVHHFSEDFISYEIVKNNEDFSESEILMESYLSESEINEKFVGYLIN